MEKYFCVVEKYFCVVEKYFCVLEKYFCVLEKYFCVVEKYFCVLDEIYLCTGKIFLCTGKILLCNRKIYTITIFFNLIYIFALPLWATVGPPRLFKTILVHFFVVLQRSIYMYVGKYYICAVCVLNYTLNSVNVHYSQRKHIYFTAKNAFTD